MTDRLDPHHRDAEQIRSPHRGALEVARKSTGGIVAARGISSSWRVPDEECFGKKPIRPTDITFHGIVCPLVDEHDCSFRPDTRKKNWPPDCLRNSQGSGPGDEYNGREGLRLEPNVRNRFREEVLIIMIPTRRLLAVPLAILAMMSAASASQIRDSAGMFSPDAIRRADSILKQAPVPILIETIPSLQGKSPEGEAMARARQHPNARVYVLISRDDHKLRIEQNRGNLTDTQSKAITNAFFSEFRKNRFDAGLIAGSESLASAVSTWGKVASAPAGGRNVAAPQARSPFSFLLVIGGIVLVVLLGMRLLGGLFGAGRNAGYGATGGMRPGGPGMGYGGGYGAGGGGGGGGFFSGMLGGLGGAIAGNWMYDQFRGRNHDTGYHGDMTGGDVGGDAGWSDAGGGDWGGGGDVSDAGGGDWGGAGGGDWGGGGDAGGSDWS